MLAPSGTMKALGCLKVLYSALRVQVNQHREKLFSSVSTIVFCANHDRPLRGKHSNTIVSSDLLDFQVDAGDKLLEEHFRSCAVNAKHTSPKVQNEIIELCGDLLREDIVSKANAASGLSVLADETADISGAEQLSIATRFVNTTENGPVVREELIGFAMPKKQHAAAIAEQILSLFRESELILANPIGQGYDGCFTMAGKEGGVNRITREQCPRAHFFQCASHKLNLVINDLNQVNGIQDTVAVIKETIHFFRKSVLRQALVTNVPMLCKTRWSAQCKSIRVFVKQ